MYFSCIPDVHATERRRVVSGKMKVGHRTLQFSILAMRFQARQLFGDLTLCLIAPGFVQQRLTASEAIVKHSRL